MHFDPNHNPSPDPTPTARELSRYEAVVRIRTVSVQPATILTKFNRKIYHCACPHPSNNAQGVQEAQYYMYIVKEIMNLIHEVNVVPSGKNCQEE